MPKALMGWEINIEDPEIAPVFKGKNKFIRGVFRMFAGTDTRAHQGEETMNYSEWLLFCDEIIAVATGPKYGLGRPLERKKKVSFFAAQDVIS